MVWVKGIEVFNFRFGIIFVYQENYRLIIYFFWIIVQDNSRLLLILNNYLECCLNENLGRRDNFWMMRMRFCF